MKIQVLACFFLLFIGAAETPETKDRYLFVYETPTQVFVHILRLTQEELAGLVKDARRYTPLQIGKIEEPYGDSVIIANEKNEILFKIFLDPEYSFRHRLAILEQQQKKSAS